MIDNDNGHLTGEQLIELTRHLVRSEEVARAAAGHLKPFDFSETEEFPTRLLWMVTGQFLSEHNRLPLRSELDVQLENASKMFPVDGRRERLNKMLADVWATDEFHPERARKLLSKQFFYSRVIHYGIAAAHDNSIDDKFLERLSLEMRDARSLMGSTLSFSDFSAAIQLNKAETFSPATFVSTGYPRLDKTLAGGFALGEVTVLAAGSAVGKTVFGVNLATRMALADAGVVFLSLEMKMADIWKLATCIVGRVHRSNLRSGNPTQEDAAGMETAHEKLSPRPLYVIDRNSIPSDSENPGVPTLKTIDMLLRGAIEKHKIKVIIIDYLAKIGPFNDDELSRMAKLTSWIHKLAQELNVHVIAIAQHNKAAYGQTGEKSLAKTNMQNVRGGIELVADPDNVIILSRPDWNNGQPDEEYSDKADFLVSVVKARHSSTDKVVMEYHKSLGIIDEMPLEQIKQLPDRNGKVPRKRTPVAATSQAVSAMAVTSTRHLSALAAPNN